MGLHLSQAPLPVGDQDGGRLLHDLQAHARLETALGKGFQVLHDANDAMRVVTDQVCFDIQTNNQKCFVLRDPKGREQTLLSVPRYRFG